MPINNIYNEILTYHNMHPSNKYDLENHNIELEGVNPSCGDDIFLRLYINNDGIIENAAFNGDGCAISQASADIMIDMVKGKTKEQAIHLSRIFMKMIKEGVSEDELEELEEASALKDISHMPARVKCAVLSWRTLAEALGEDIE